ncbi:hypothetical protein GE061_010994 [Apolygus lucorum]|uniref:Uncharacterized protein n=1 Tax=Apolygus lucorum TaxID=248454 RepID=A0A6A4K512_APOLU|nr:hypothetical protein GE061_010994 [Apolygus lucorum]
MCWAAARISLLDGTASGSNERSEGLSPADRSSHSGRRDAREGHVSAEDGARRWRSGAGRRSNDDYWRTGKRKRPLRARRQRAPERQPSSRLRLPQGAVSPRGRLYRCQLLQF